jgi:hypothetical protein
LRRLIGARNPELAAKVRTLDDVHRLQDVTLPGYCEADEPLLRESWERLHADVKTARLFGYPAAGGDQVEIGETDQELGEIHIWNETLSRDGRVIFTHVRFLVPEPQPEESPPPVPQPADPAPVGGAPDEVADPLPPKDLGGRPAIVTQDKVDAEVFRLMDERLEFCADDPEWNAQARLEDAIGDFCEALTGRRPKETSLKNYVKAPLQQWRQRSKT